MNRRVLIVEDERLVARELGNRLETNGYKVTARVAAADEALRAAEAEVPDIVLMDIRIEGDRDGIETAAQLRQRYDVPVVFLTAYSDDETVERAKPHGAAYLIKPLRERELIVALELALYRHQQARTARARERYLATALVSAGDAVISTDEAGRISFMNPVAELLTGWRTEEAAGQPLLDVVKIEYDAVHDGVLIDRTGNRRTITETTSPMFDDAGALLGGVMVIRDVTDLRALQLRQQAADRLTSLGVLAAGLAEELDNPLTWIRANLEHLAAVLDAPAIADRDRNVLRHEVAQARRGADRIVQIMGALIAFQHQGDEAATCDVGAVIQQVLASVTTPIEIAVALDGPLTAPLAESRLVRVLNGLVTNAIHAIEAAAPGTHRIEIRAHHVDDRLAISVADTGVGMDEQTRSRAIEPFFTTARGHRPGLGLSVAHGLVTAAGGTLELASLPALGTTVTLALPRPREEPLPVAVPRHLVEQRARILVVDDELAMRTLMGRLLHRHEVHSARAVDALERLRAGQRFDVIVCDLMMPDLPGAAFYEALVALDPLQARRIVFMTGGGLDERAATFLRSSRHRLLEKPFTSATLLAAIHECLAAASAS